MLVVQTLCASRINKLLAGGNTRSSLYYLSVFSYLKVDNDNTAKLQALREYTCILILFELD